MRGFDEALDLGSVMPGGGDLDILWRVLTGGFSIIYEPRVLAWHEHRRELSAVFDQIIGHQLALIAFLTKSFVRARGWTKLQILAFLVWRLLKPGVRLIRRLVGRDPLPVSVIFRMWWNCWRGIRAYSGARKETASYSDSRSAGIERGPCDPGNADGLTADPPLSRLVELWHYRGLLRRLIIRNLMVKYQRSLLGFLWTLINPIVTLVVLIAVFSHVVRIPIPNYWAFLLSGYFVWNFTIQTLNMGTYIFAEHSKLLRTASFPSEILVFSAAIAKFIEFAAAMVLVLIALIAFHHNGVPLSFSILPLLVFIQLLVIVGMALLITSLSIFYYDVHHALPIALATLFYASPVFYPVSLVPEIIRPYYMLNPIAGLLKLFHLTIYEGSMPPISLLAGMLAYSAAIFLLGYAIFRRYETVYAEIV
jgi:ABC-type polysaccharide/polyol phosphate export permease